MCNKKASMRIVEWRRNGRELFSKCLKQTSLTNLPGIHKNRTLRAKRMGMKNKAQFYFYETNVRESGLSYGPASTWICLIFCEWESGRSKLERRTSSFRQPWIFNSNICDESFWKFIFSFVLNAAFNLLLFTHHPKFVPECSSSSSCAKIKTFTFYPSPHRSNIMQMTHFSA